MADRTPRPGEQHPDRYVNDLNPNRMAGQNYGRTGPHPEDDARLTRY